MVLGLLKRRKNVYRDPVSQRIIDVKLEEVENGIDVSACSLAMAEMTSLVAAVYQRYTTSLVPGFEHTSPAITSRVELFYDETQPKFAVS